LVPYFYFGCNPLAATAVAAAVPAAVPAAPAVVSGAISVPLEGCYADAVR
jgi:hypothetical protein